MLGLYSTTGIPTPNAVDMPPHAAPEEARYSYVHHGVHALESGNCTSRGIRTDVTCQMIIRRFDQI